MVGPVSTIKKSWQHDLGVRQSNRYETTHGRIACDPFLCQECQSVLQRYRKHNNFRQASVIVLSYAPEPKKLKLINLANEIEVNDESSCLLVSVVLGLDYSLNENSLHSR
jgi:hypothetical protein